MRINRLIHIFLKVIVWGFVTVNYGMAQSSMETKITDKKQTPPKTQEFHILGSTDRIFPKSKVDTPINPAFERSQFNVNTALKSKSNQFKQTEKYGNTNSQFAMPKKTVDEKQIPQEIRDMLKKQNTN
jgi:hypothetical protein